MKIILVLLSSLLASNVFAMEVCLKKENTCAKAELMGCEGGHLGYQTTQIGRYSATSPGSKALALLDCQDDMKRIKATGPLECKEIKNSCDKGEIQGCEGGYALIKLNTETRKLFPEYQFKDTLKACLEN